MHRTLRVLGNYWDVRKILDKSENNGRSKV